MSAVTQNYEYTYGKKKPGAKSPMLSKKELESMKKDMGKFVAVKKK